MNRRALTNDPQPGKYHKRYAADLDHYVSMRLTHNQYWQLRREAVKQRIYVTQHIRNILFGKPDNGSR